MAFIISAPAYIAGQKIRRAGMAQKKSDEALGASPLIFSPLKEMGASLSSPQQHAKMDTFSIHQVRELYATQTAASIQNILQF